MKKLVIIIASLFVMGIVVSCKGVTRSFSNNFSYKDPTGKYGTLRTLTSQESIHCKIIYWDTDSDDYRYIDDNGKEHFCSGPTDFMADNY